MEYLIILMMENWEKRAVRALLKRQDLQQINNVLPSSKVSSGRSRANW